MTGNEFMNILKSPTAKVVIFGALLILGALIIIPLLARNDDMKAVKQETELTQEEKAPIDINTDIPRFNVDKRSKDADKKPEKKPEPPKNADDLMKRMMERSEAKHPSANPFQDRNPQNNTGMYVLSAQNNGQTIPEKEVFTSERYAPYGRMLDCKLVNTLESNIDGTPLIAMVIEDLWWTNSKGERKLIIPAGTEVHGRMSSCVRNRITASGTFVLVWQLTSGEVGMELQLNGRVLEKSNQAGTKDLATITDMAAGIPGRVMNNQTLDEILKLTMAFTQGLATGFQENKIYDNGRSIIQENSGSTKNALATAFKQMSTVALEGISDKIKKESYYVRVSAGTEFYLYIEQVTNVEKAAIADTALNKLAQIKQALPKENGDRSSMDKLTKFHESLGQSIPKQLQTELKKGY